MPSGVLSKLRTGPCETGRVATFPHLFRQRCPPCSPPCHNLDCRSALAMRARSPRICSEQQGGVGGVLLQHGAASGMTGAHLMTVDAPSTLPLRLADLSGSYNIQMTGASSGVARSGKLLIQGRISSHSLSSTRGRDARFQRRGGVNLGLIWPPRLALVTDTGAGLGVARSGKTFISLPFPSIWFHFPSPEPSSSPSPRGRRDLPGARFPPSRERR